MGIPEEQDSDVKIHELIDTLMPEVKIDYIIIERIGARGLVARPIRVKFEDNNHKRRLLAKAKEFRNEKSMDKIYIVPDMIKAQQEEDKKLKQKVKALRLAGEIVKMV